MTLADAVAAVADLLERAEQTGAPCAPIAGLLPEGDIDAAYAVQQLVLTRHVASGARRIGRKIGLTSEAIQRQVGVDRPDFGVLLDTMHYASGDTIPAGVLLQPRAEAEVAFVLGSDISDASDPAVVRAAVATAHAAIEVVDSRIADWKIGIVDTIADNASSGVFVMTGHGIPIADVDTVGVTMTMSRNDETVSTGSGAACLGDPLNALAWLAETAIALGDPLRAGDIVLSGALGPMVAASVGDTFTADIAPLGRVEVRFGTHEENTHDC